jgi:hypothetical protein
LVWDLKWALLDRAERFAKLGWKQAHWPD